MGDRLSRSVPFSQYAPDHVLRASTSDLIVLRERFSVPGEPWTDEFTRRLQITDPEFIREAVALLIKAPGGFEKPQDFNADDLPFGLAVAVQPVADAIECGISGQSYADLLKAREAVEAARARNLEAQEAGLDAAERDAARGELMRAD